MINVSLCINTEGTLSQISLSGLDWKQHGNNTTYAFQKGWIRFPIFSLLYVYIYDVFLFIERHIDEFAMFRSTQAVVGAAQSKPGESAV